ncbi:MAG TPA: TIGR00366 family protein [Acidobacteriota bacterium]|nr:TIGR00366 family protein [Acidobacteriota bacterium]
MRRLGAVLAIRLRRWIPDPFVFAILLTLGVGVAAWAATEAGPGEVLDAWFRGFWLLLEFAMQMVLVLATGYAIALSSAASQGIDGLARRIHQPWQVYLTVLLAGSLLTLASWGWVVLTAVLARELAARVEGIDYPFLTACVFVSSWSWVCGLSSTIPLLLNTEGNFLIEAGLLSGAIGMEHTLGSRLNLTYFSLFAVLIPAVMLAVRPRAGEATSLAALRQELANPLTVAQEAAGTRLPVRALSDLLNHSAWLSAAVVVAGTAFLIRYFAAGGFDLNLNLMIFLFLVLGIAVHRTPMRYVVAMRRACSNISGLVFQYPFYAGIMGMMMFTGLGAIVAEELAARATPATLPAIAQLVGAGVNFAIPSAGGEWAVVGPGLVETANRMATDLAPAEHRALIGRVAMAVAYGETSSNLLQPFFLLSIMPVMGAGVRIQARDVMGHMAAPFAVFYLLTLVLVTWSPIN